MPGSLSGSGVRAAVVVVVLAVDGDDASSPATSLLVLKVAVPFERLPVPNEIVPS
jgi:hypothetical protein